MLIFTGASQSALAEEKIFVDSPRYSKEYTGPVQGTILDSLVYSLHAGGGGRYLQSYKKQTAMWSAGSGNVTARAKTQIWSNMADTNIKMKPMQTNADALILAAVGSDLEATKAAFGSVGRACGRCHKVYRRPEF